MKKVISNFLIKRGFKRLQKDIRELNSSEIDAEKTIEFLFSKKGELIQPWQFKSEILSLAQEIEKIKPETAVEIGTANGGTLFMLSRLASPSAKIVSIDLPGGDFGGGHPDWKVPIYKSFGRKSQEVNLLREDSHDPKTFEQLKDILGGKKIDYLFIDGDHTYEGVKHDFELYKPLVKEGGKVGFHDVVVHPWSRCDVYKFWNEVKTEYPSQEFVQDWNQEKFGVGLIKV